LFKTHVESGVVIFFNSSNLVALWRESI